MTGMIVHQKAIIVLVYKWGKLE